MNTQLNPTDLNENLLLRQNLWAQQPNGNSLFEEINHKYEKIPNQPPATTPIYQETKYVKELAHSFDHNKCRQLPYYSR